MPMVDGCQWSSEALISLALWTRKSQRLILGHRCAALPNTKISGIKTWGLEVPEKQRPESLQTGMRRLRPRPKLPGLLSRTSQKRLKKGGAVWVRTASPPRPLCSKLGS